MKPPNRLIASALIVILLLPSQQCQAWSEGGHHLIAAVAFSLLTEKEQAELVAVLQMHLRYAEDFVPPDELRLLEKTRRLSPVFLQFSRTFVSLAPWRETRLCGAAWSRDPESLAKAQRTQRERPRSFINAGSVPGASVSKISNHHSTIINQIQKSPIRLAYARTAVLVPPSG